MKYNKILSIAAATVLMCGCADNAMYTEAPAEPGVTGQDGYTYLKSYVNRSENPNFKLGAGIEASDVFAHYPAWTVAKQNFDEVTPGNLMKFNSVVKDDGVMDFRGVADFVNEADAAGLTVYGHTLCWHSQQNITYLKSLLAPPNYFLHATSSEEKANDWDASITYQLSNPLTKGKKYTISFKGKASSAVNVCFWPSSDDEGKTQYLPAFAFTTTWSQISYTWTPDYALNKMNFEFGKFAGDICIDDFSIVEEGSTENLALNSDFEDADINAWSKPSWHNHTTLIRDKEESENAGGEEAAKDSLNKVLDKWVSGMMEACQGKVKAFDVVNEPMSDAAPAELKKAGRKVGTETNVDGNPKECFFWQDYLGKDYARIVVALARKYGPTDLKLFVNDYNLEAAYNNNAKCQGLIDMINYWESDGVTKIDGIGTQMHVSVSMDPAAQKRNEAAVVNQFKLLAATGKLIKISELDMGILAADGKTKILTANATEEQIEGQKAFYSFIIKAYFENIPAAQRYGITQWSLTDSPEKSGWRPNEPIGLWDKDLNRKPTYAGFADGLANK